MKVKPIPVICISGPTASGKSAFALSLAKSLNAEIINADSVQVYRGFDIGSAKPSEAELSEVPHHLVSHVDPSEHYSVGRFRKEAMECIIDISSRGRIPLVVGGSGLYIRGLFSSFLDSWGFSVGEEILEKITSRVSPVDKAGFQHQLLQMLDADTARKFPVQDQRRVERSLVQILSGGVPLSALKSLRNADIASHSETRSDTLPHMLFPLVWILDQDRSVLYEKINKRVSDMLDAGWIEEVANLRQNVSRTAPPFNSIGYRHLGYLDYSMFQDLPPISDDLIDEIRRDTRRFAKRQLTWWRNQPNVLDWKSVFEVCSDYPEVGIAESDLCILKDNGLSDSQVSDTTLSSKIYSKKPPSVSSSDKGDEIRGTREFCELYLREFSRRFVKVIQEQTVPRVNPANGNPDVWYGRLRIDSQK